MHSSDNEYIFNIIIFIYLEGAKILGVKFRFDDIVVELAEF